MRAALEDPIVRAMSLRPAPDLIYRTVDADNIRIGPVTAKRRDMIILCLPGATQTLLVSGTPSAELIFGGLRKPRTDRRCRTIRCTPVRPWIWRWGMTGILAALLSVADSGPAGIPDRARL